MSAKVSGMGGACMEGRREVLVERVAPLKVTDKKGVPLWAIAYGSDYNGLHPTITIIPSKTAIAPGFIDECTIFFSGSVDRPSGMAMLGVAYAPMRTYWSRTDLLADLNGPQFAQLWAIVTSLHEK